MIEVWEMRHGDNAELVRTMEVSRHVSEDEASTAQARYKDRFPWLNVGLFHYSNARGAWTPLYIWPAS